jgi:cation diffusion facilitator family transporter
MDDCCSKRSETLNALAQGDQRRVLVIVMAVNAVMFVAEFGFGLVANSTAMMADSIDMLGDAIVYGLSLYALGRGQRWQAGAALAKGGLILGFGAGIIAETAFKVDAGVIPSSGVMLVVTAIALIANFACLGLLWRFRRLNVNTASTFECSRNDVLANVGVLVAAGLVTLTHAGWPDVLAGLVIAFLFLRSAARVLRPAWPVWRGQAGAIELD